MPFAPQNARRRRQDRCDSYRSEAQPRTRTSTLVMCAVWVSIMLVELQRQREPSLGLISAGCGQPVKKLAGSGDNPSDSVDGAVETLKILKTLAEPLAGLARRE